VDYNLLEEKWIPVLYKDGKPERVGITKALEQAKEIRQIAASNPMDRAAILRFLLALLYWCRGNTPDKLPGDSLPCDWFQKLHDHRDCFNLLGEGKRFYQYKRNDGQGKLSANYLMQEVPTGTNFWHFRHSTDESDGLCPACCAMGLLRLPLFATSGGRGKPPGINAKPPIYVMPLGSSLAGALRLSWRKVPSAGTPAWEKPDLELPKTGEVPMLMGLTYLPRRVWLDDPEEPEANCISCGHKERLIRRSVFAGIGSTRTSGERAWSDPHVISDTKDVMKPSNALGASDAAAAQWAQIMAGILRGQKDIRTGRVWVVGFATVQNDKYLEAMECEIPFQHKLDAGQVQANVEKIERWLEEGWKLARKAKPREASRKHLEIPPMVSAVRPQAEARVSAKMGELISANGEAWEQAAGEYSPMMDAIAKSLSPGFTTVALRRQNQIAGVKPNMRSDTTAAVRAGRKKRGDK
jgi:CRISPR-associated protein Cse1 family